MQQVSAFNRFFQLSIHASAVKIQPDKVVRWWQNGDFCVLYLLWAACSTFQTCILNSHWGHTMWRYSTQKNPICAPLHNFVGLYLHNWNTYWQSEKKLLKQQYLPTCPYNMVNFVR